MKTELRPYQQEAVNAVYEHLSTEDTNPCVVLPTGTGRSLVLAKAASDAVTLWGSRLLILAQEANSNSWLSLALAGPSVPPTPVGSRPSCC